MAKKEFVQLAHTYKKQNITGWYVSEKLDGMRAYWDGGITRGMPKSSVPWANTDKDERYVIAPDATGLWSRYGNVIHAPDWWLDTLPKCPLDGELYIPGYRQDLMKIVKQLDPDSRWEKVEYHVFDCPPFSVLFPDHKEWIGQHKGAVLAPAPLSYSLTLQLLQSQIGLHPFVKIVEQIKLPSVDSISALLEAVVSKGGEGLVVRAPWAKYEACRSHNLLKVKPYDDAEGKVTGYIAGHGKYLGMVGAIVLDCDGTRLELSGFTDAERFISSNNISDWANLHPGMVIPDYNHPQFPLGTMITYKYRGLSKDGVPQEARYFRKKEEE